MSHVALQVIARLLKKKLMESKNLAMVTVLKEEEIELELGLSIGGSYRRQNGIELRSDTHVDVVLREKNVSCERYSNSPSFMLDEKDQKTKREIHALRRQEAKKKREEKQMKRGLCKGNFNNIYNNNNNNNNNNGMTLKVKGFHAEGDIEEREFKKIKKEKNGSEGKKVNHNTGTCYPTPPLTVLQQVPYGMPANGLIYPCWFASGGGTADPEERNVVQVQPAVGYGFVPFRAALNSGHNWCNGYDSEQNCSSTDGGNRTGCSSKCTSCTGSDHRSSSEEGGGSSSSSSYTRSHSSPSMPEQPQSNGWIANDAVSRLKEAINNVEKLIPSNTSQSSPTQNKHESTPETGLNPTDNRISTAENSNSNYSMESTGDIGKPPKPLAKTLSNCPPLPYMPCVSTTGNGPNGKTINGFLYRYTKTEVSIICVCHGSSFSPAEFVQHAGGTDVSHPLRHITVISSAF